MKRVILFTSVLLCATLVVCWNYWKGNPAGPIYYGKPVVDWALDLTSPSVQVRHDAALAIGAFDADAIPVLVRLLHTSDPIFAHVVRLVGWHVPQRVAHTLFRMANPYEAPIKRAAAAQALRIMGTRAAPAIPALTRALGDDKTVSWHAALALAQFGQDGVTALSSKLDTAPPAQADFICYALSEMGRTASNAAPALIRQLGSKDSNVVERAGTALSAIGPAAVPLLLEALGKTNSGTRLVVIRALSQMGPVARRAVPGLLQCARSSDPTERAAAVAGLGQIQPTSPAVVAALTAALVDSARPVRLQGIEGLSRSPGTARPAETAVRRALNDENLTIRERATNLLAQIAAAPARAEGRNGQTSDANQRSMP